MQVRILTLDGLVSNSIFTIEEGPDHKNVMVLKDPEGVRQRIHQRRLLPANAAGKAVTLVRNNKRTGICPKCRRVLEVAGNELNCPADGNFETVNIGILEVNMSTDSARFKEVHMAQEELKVVDMGQIAQYGELWTKDQVRFDHPTVAVKAHVLLADGPVRKLCFNTYNGALGRKIKDDPVEVLNLVAFRAGTDPGQATKHKIYFPANATIDVLRKQLEKSGYTCRRASAPTEEEPDKGVSEDVGVEQTA